jgi:Tol biopolymer transport system component
MARFEREAQVLASLNHPNIAAIYVVSASVIAQPPQAVEYLDHNGSQTTMEAERVRAQLDRILASAAFAEAERASRVLRFVVTRALDGRADQIKESVIGVEVLGRSPSFDPKTDPIVRVEAGRLRGRLNSYYLNEGNGDTVQIAMPKGGYVPEFSERASPTPRKARHPGVFLVSGVLLGFAAAALVQVYFRKAADPGDVVRFSILAPRSAEIEHSVISPDGRKVAFSATVGGKLQLWVRALDSLEARALPGTEGAAYPFWSPDSRSLGFFTRSNLKRIEISGGPAQAVCKGGPFQGGTWSSEGVIVYAPAARGVLYQVPADGGSPKPVTVLDPVRDEIAHQFPQFLPDARHFLYFAASSPPGGSSIRVGSLDSLNSKFLVNAEASGAYAPRPGDRLGLLLLVYGGALLAQPFDPWRLELSGGRMTVAPEILHWIGHSEFSVSTTGSLAYRAGSHANRQLEWFDRQGRALGSVGPLNDYVGWSLSPDGKRIALREHEPTGVETAIWVMELASGASSRLTDGSGYVGPPIWSPDGSAVLFSMSDGRGDGRGMSLQLQSLSGRTSVAVLKSEGPKFLSDWSPDGRFVAYFTRWPEFKKSNIFIAEVGSSGVLEKPRILPSPYGEASAYFSPAAKGGGPRWIAYTSDETGRGEVYVRNLPAGDRKWPVSTGGGWQPHWRPDGRELFYLTLEGTLMAVEVKNGGTFEPGLPHPLFQTAVPPPPGLELPTNAYAVSKDGTRFLINGTKERAAPSPITIVTHWQTSLR